MDRCVTLSLVVANGNPIIVLVSMILEVETTSSKVGRPTNVDISTFYGGNFH